MYLTIEGHKREFIPLHTFRAQWGLPDDFGMFRFEQKDWPVGTLNTVGDKLALITKEVVEAVPAAITPAELLRQVDALAALFRDLLESANVRIGLRQVEIDYAVDGFQNVLQAVAYQLLRLSQTYAGDLVQVRQHFDFLTVYQAWLDASTRVFASSHVYVHDAVQFAVRVVYYAYGRVGLEVTVENQNYYVLDPVMACPATHFMEDLCQRAAHALCQAVTR